MININYTHTANSGSASKAFKLTTAEELTVEQKVPNQARQIINYIVQLAQEQDTFTYNDVVEYIDNNHEGTFTNSKGGTMRIVRYYSKLLQTIGLIEEA